MKGDEIILWLTQSEARCRVLHALSEPIHISDPIYVSRFQKMQPVTKETKEAILEQYIEWGWVREQGDQYELTTGGEIIHSHYEQFGRRIDSTKRPDEQINQEKPQSVVREEFRKIGRSKKRRSLLRALGTPTRRANLHRCLDLSRSKVARDLDYFTNQGWVKREGRLHQQSTAGESIIQAYDLLVRAIELVHDKSTVLQHYDEDLNPSLKILEHATSESYSEELNHHGLTKMQEIVSSGVDCIRGISPIFSEPAHDLFGERLADQGVEIEYILTGSVITKLRSRRPDIIEYACRTENVEIYAPSQSIGVGLMIVDETAMILGVYDETGQLCGGIEGTDEELIDWALTLYRQYRENARRLEAIVTGPVTEVESNAN